MSPVWHELLADAEERVLPWTGSRKVYWRNRAWSISGELPAEYGWFRFRTTSGRKATLLGPADPDPGYEEGHPVLRGYLAGDRLIPDDARVELDPNRLVEQTQPVLLVEPGLERFSRAVTVRTGGGQLVYLHQEFPQGPEDEVQAAFQDRMGSLAHISGVTPALDLAFRWLSRQRDLAEERQRRHQQRLAEEQMRRAEAEQRREAARQMRRAMRDAGTGAGRRALARRDFAAAAREALRISGAELLDVRRAYGRNEMIVQYRFRRRRFECVVDRVTLQVVDSGICLTDEMTGERGDTYFTLESLPAVVGEAIDQGVLVVYRHA
jgi:hypothetical protein